MGKSKPKSKAARGLHPKPSKPDPDDPNSNLSPGAPRSALTPKTGGSTASLPTPPTSHEGPTQKELGDASNDEEAESVDWEGYAPEELDPVKSSDALAGAFVPWPESARDDVTWVLKGALKERESEASALGRTVRAAKRRSGHFAGIEALSWSSDPPHSVAPRDTNALEAEAAEWITC